MRIVLALLAAATPVFADDWTQWRGANRDGVWGEKGILETLPADGLKVRWRTPVGPGYSSPVIAQGRVFLTDCVLGPKEARKAKERVLCFAERTGEALWSFAYDVAYPDYAWPPDGPQGPCPTPIVDGDRMYTVGGMGHVFCFDAATGAILWQKDLAQDYKMLEFGTRGSPLIEGDLLILPKCYNTSPGIIAMEKASGRVKWTALDEGGYNSSPVAITAGGKRQLIMPGRKAVYSLDPATGKIWWETPFECGIPTPVVSGDRLLVNGMMFTLDAEKPAATVVWPERKPDADLSDTTTAVIVGDLVVSHKKKDRLVGLDARTGRILWDAKVTSVMHSLTVCDGGLFVFTDEGELIRARVSEKGYEELGRCKLIKPTELYGKRPTTWSAPSYANGHVFVRNNEELLSASLVLPPGE
jgi:outer membrane protein assembly factor BamB